MEAALLPTFLLLLTLCQPRPGHLWSREEVPFTSGLLPGQHTLKHSLWRPSDFRKHLRSGGPRILEPTVFL